METAKQLFESDRLAEAIGALNQDVKSRPTDINLRTFLFELLCFQGAYERAAKQLDVIAAQGGDAGTELAVQVYRGLLGAESLRQRVFEGDALPKFVASPAPHIEHYLVMLKKLQSAPHEIGELLDQAEEESPAVGGARGEQRFSTFRDADDRVAAVLEVYHGSSYLWISLDQVERLEITPPKKLRDLMWAQARVQLADQPMGDVFIPALYVNSHRHESDAVKLGRMTEWEALHDRVVIGAGQRVYLIDEQEVGLLELGEVSFAPQPTGAPTR